MSKFSVKVYHEKETAQTGNPHPNISTTWKSSHFQEKQLFFNEKENLFLDQLKNVRYRGLTIMKHLHGKVQARWWSMEAYTQVCWSYKMKYRQKLGCQWTARRASRTSLLQSELRPHSQMKIITITTTKIIIKMVMTIKEKNRQSSSSDNIFLVRA